MQQTQNHFSGQVLLGFLQQRFFLHALHRSASHITTTIWCENNVHEINCFRYYLK